jgi:hypothetical protein
MTKGLFQGFIFLFSHTAVYLKGELARLELSLLSYFTANLLNADFQLFANPGTQTV